MIDEGVLRRRIGGPEVMHDQLVHLTEVVERPMIKVHVIPTEVGAHIGLLGAFAIADVAGDVPGIVRRRHHEQQTEQMWCLTLATNAVVTWTTEYHGLAVAALRRGGRHIDDAVLAHIWPTHHENVHFYGTHSVDVDGELAKLDSDGYRPLRAPGPAPAADEAR